jgi:hypothetical protein
MATYHCSKRTQIEWLHRRSFQNHTKKSLA